MSECNNKCNVSVSYFCSSILPGGVISYDTYAWLFFLTRALCSTKFSVINYDEDIKTAQRARRVTGPFSRERAVGTHRGWAWGPFKGENSWAILDIQTEGTASRNCALCFNPDQTIIQSAFWGCKMFNNMTRIYFVLWGKHSFHQITLEPRFF